MPPSASSAMRTSWRCSIPGDSAGAAHARCRPRSGGVGAAHPATALGRALVLVQAAPGAVLLWAGNGVVQAIQADGAASANGLGLAFPDLSLRLTLTVRAEEDHKILATTRGSILPPPVWAGEHSRLPAYLRHGSVTSKSCLVWSVQVVGYPCFQAHERTRTWPVAVTAVADATLPASDVFPCGNSRAARAILGWLAAVTAWPAGACVRDPLDTGSNTVCLSGKA
jgi:hypothetical protein